MAQPQVRRNTWDGPPGGRSTVDATETELLHVYIYDYCKKHNFNQAARFFAAEANVAADQRPPIDIATGFLADWWGVFWDVYHAQNKDTQAPKGANEEYHDLVRSRKEEVLQQQRTFSMQQAVQQQQQQQSRRASEMQRLAQSPQLHHNTQQAHSVQPPHVPSQQQQQQQLIQSRDHRASPVNSIASLPNSGGMAPPNNNVAGGSTNGNSIANTPQTIPASLPQQQTGNNRLGTSSPSFSPQQVQRPGVPSNGVNENMPGHPDAMMNSPMVNAQGMPMNAQGQMMMNQRVAVSPHSAIIINIMNALGLGGRDPQSLTPEEKANVQAHIRRHTMQMNQNGMMRNPNMMAVNNQAQARLQMQQQMMANQQLMQQQQQQQQQQRQQQQQPQMHHNQPQTPQMQHRMPHNQSQPLQQQQQQYMPHGQNQIPQQAQTPQQQAQSLPQSQQQQHSQAPIHSQQGNQVPQNPHQALGQQQSQHGVTQSNHPGMNNQAGNGQRIPGGMAPDNTPSAGQGQMVNSMQNSEQFNGGEGMNMMLAEQMMKSGQLSGLTHQQQQQFMMEHYHQQQRMLFNQRRMMQQQGGQTPPNPNMMSPIPPAPMNAGSPQDADKNNASLAQYQRQQLQYTMQQRQQYNQQQHQPPFSQDQNNNPSQSPQMNRNMTKPPQQQQTPNQKRQMQQQQQQQQPAQKRQRTGTDADGPQNANQSPSPHLMNSTPIPPNAHNLPGSSHVSPVIPQPNYNQDPTNVKPSQSPQMDRGMAKPPTPQQPQTRTPQQANRQLHTQGTPAQQEQSMSRMGWNPSPLGDGGNMQSSGMMDGNKSPSTVGMETTGAAFDNGPNSTMVSSFDLERFMMSDGGDFGEIFTQEQNLLMGSDNNEIFGGGFLSNMGGGGFGGDTSSSLVDNPTLLQLYGQLTGHNNKVSTVAFSSDAQWLASAGHDKKVLVWSVQDKQLRWTLEGHTAQITCARWSPDQHNLLVTSSYDKSLRVWDLDQATQDAGEGGLKPAAKFNCKAQITAVDFAPDRPDTICSLDAEGELNVWHIPSAKIEKTIKLTASKSLFAANPLRFHPRLGKIVACAAGNQIFVINIDAAKNNASSGDSAAVRTINAEHSKNICSLDWSVDGSYLVTASENEVMVYETGHWKLINKHTASDKISACAFMISPINDNHGGGETGGATGARKMCVVYGSYESIYVWHCNVPGSQPQRMGRQSGMVAGLACIQRNGQPVVASASHYKEKNLMLWTL